MLYLYVLLFLSLWIVYKVVQYVQFTQKLKEIPASNAKGIMADISEFYEFLQKNHSITPFFDKFAQLGPIAQIRLGPLVSVVVLSDPQEIEDVLLRRNEDFVRAKMTTDLFIGTIPKSQISFPTNHQWKTHRRLMGPAMTSTYLKQFTPRISQAGRELVKLWNLKRALNKARPFEVKTDLMYVMTDAISSVASSESLGSIEAQIKSLQEYEKQGNKSLEDFNFQVPPILAATKVLFEALGDCMMSAAPRYKHITIRMTSTWRKSDRLIRSFLLSQAQASRKRLQLEGLEDNELADSMVDMMIKKELIGKEADHIDQDELIDELITFFIAGSETTAVTLAWMVKMLARHPEFQQKLHEELKTKLPSPDERSLSYDDVLAENVPLLNAFLSEVQRFSRTAGGVSRMAARDTKLLGKFIPKGTTIYLALGLVAVSEKASDEKYSKSLDGLRSPSSLAAGRKAGYFTDPAKFYPERWLDKDGNYDANMGPSFPFSLGQRSCWGAKLAFVQLKIVTATLCLEFCFDQVPAELDGDQGTEKITFSPNQAFVNLRPWKTDA